ncbi:hypothetical protein [Pantoea ananatis]|uniref:hypothetical protein n=1 Tax=Pantoea ananas TaxID=553 RepID=UPI0020CA8BEF|nr:hypothetical protein [Pantoea ananatis]
MNHETVEARLNPNSHLKVVKPHETSDDYDTIKHGSGSGGGDDMQARVAKLESDVEHIKNSLKEIKDDVREIKRDARTDFRVLFGAIIALALGLSGLMAKGFHWL